MPFVYDRVPPERLDHYKHQRHQDHMREQYLINKRFPQLEVAREEYLGKEILRSPAKNIHA